MMKTISAWNLETSNPKLCIWSAQNGTLIGLDTRFLGLLEERRNMLLRTLGQFGTFPHHETKDSKARSTLGADTTHSSTGDDEFPSSSSSSSPSSSSSDRGDLYTSYS